MLFRLIPAILISQKHPPHRPQAKCTRSSISLAPAPSVAGPLEIPVEALWQPGAPEPSESGFSERQLFVVPQVAVSGPAGDNSSHGMYGGEVSRTKLQATGIEGTKEAECLSDIERDQCSQNTDPVGN